MPEENRYSKDFSEFPTTENPCKLDRIRFTIFLRNTGRSRACMATMSWSEWFFWCDKRREPAPPFYQDLGKEIDSTMTRHVGLRSPDPHSLKRGRLGSVYWGLNFNLPKTLRVGVSFVSEMENFTGLKSRTHNREGANWSDYPRLQSAHQRHRNPSKTTWAYIYISCSHYLRSHGWNLIGTSFTYL